MTVVKVALSIVGIVILAIVAIIVGVVKIFPQYAPGEARAIVENRYPTYHMYGDPEYILEGRWQVTAGDPSGQDWQITLYERTGTIEASEMLVQAPAPGSSPFSAFFWLLIGNLILLAANVILAVFNWSRMRRTR